LPHRRNDAAAVAADAAATQRLCIDLQRHPTLRQPRVTSNTNTPASPPGTPGFNGLRLMGLPSPPSTLRACGLQDLVKISVKP